jgi:hypothetical protein
MRQENHITPKLGVWSVLILSMLFLGLFVLYRNFALLGDRTYWDTDDWTHRYVLLAGGITGLLCSVNWIASAFGNPFLRWTLRMSMVFVLAQFMHMLNSDGWIQNALDLSGIVVFQSVVFFALHVPDWKNGFGNGENVVVSSRRQFGIGDIVIATTLIAILLAIGTRLKSPANVAGYWAVLLGAWAITSVIAACVAKAVLSKTVTRSIALLVIAGGLAIGGIYGLAFAESAFGWPAEVASASAKDVQKQFENHVLLYGKIAGVFSFAILATAIAGFVQASARNTAADDRGVNDAADTPG